MSKIIIAGELEWGGWYRIAKEVLNIQGLCACICAQANNTVKKICIREDNKYMDKLAIRKLTPNEYFKLMGFKTEDCNKCKNVGVSNTALYEQAGNGIVTNCVELIFEHLYQAMYNKDYKCYDEEFLEQEGQK